MKSLVNVWPGGIGVFRMPAWITGSESQENVQNVHSLFYLLSLGLAARSSILLKLYGVAPTRNQKLEGVAQPWWQQTLPMLTQPQGNIHLFSTSHTCQSFSRHAKCPNHLNQQLCKILRAWVNFSTEHIVFCHKFNLWSVFSSRF